MGRTYIGSWLRLDDGPNVSLGARIASMMQIDVDIFEPQGISKLDAQTSFLSKDLATQLIKKSFSGKEVCGTAGGGGRPSGTSQSGSTFMEGPSLAREPGRGRRLPKGERGRCFMVGIQGQFGTPVLRAA